MLGRYWAFSTDIFIQTAIRPLYFSLTFRLPSTPTSRVCLSCVVLLHQLAHLQTGESIYTEIRTAHGIAQFYSYILRFAWWSRHSVAWVYKISTKALSALQGCQWFMFLPPWLHQCKWLSCMLSLNLSIVLFVLVSQLLSFFTIHFKSKFKTCRQ